MNIGQVAAVGEKVVVKPLHKPGDMVELEDEDDLQNKSDSEQRGSNCKRGTIIPH